MYKTIESRENKFTVWGSGAPIKRVLYVDDLSNFINFIIDKDIKNDLINVGSGEEISIRNLALLIQELMNFEEMLFLILVSLMEIQKIIRFKLNERIRLEKIYRP